MEIRKTPIAVCSFSLGKSYHVVGKALKDTIVAYCVGTGQGRFVDRFLAKAKVITFLAMCRKDICQLSETITSAELSEHQCQQLIPMSESPSSGSVIVLRHKSLKALRRQELYYLTLSKVNTVLQ